MIRIVALNEDGDENEPDEQDELIVTREAQETIAESEYIRAIKLKCDGKIELCLHLLKELLQTRVLNENKKNNRNDKLWTIKYNCHKNIALILEERFEYNLALQHYISAILIDSTDISTMHRFGHLALKLNVTDLAEYAFENCLDRNSAHWCAAEGMLQIMNKNSNIIASYSCATKIFQQDDNCGNAEQTLKEINHLFKKNLLFLNECSGFENLFFEKQYQKVRLFKHLFDDNHTLKTTEDDENPDLKQFHIDHPNWFSIGQFIVKLYNYINEIKHDMLFAFNFDNIILNSDTDELLCIAKDSSMTATMSTTQKNENQPDCPTKYDEVATEHSQIVTAIKCDSTEYSNFDSNAKLDGCEINKSKPRRRCSDLQFLEQWGWHKNRRYSSRKKMERDEIDYSLNGYLRKVLEKYTKIPIEDNWPFSEFLERDNNFDSVCLPCKAAISEEHFNLTTEKEFDKFTNKIKKCIDLMEVTYKWLKYISLSLFLPLPDKLKVLYSDIFKIYISHFDFSTWNQLTPSNYISSFRICLLYLELEAEGHLNNKSDLWSSIFQHLLLNIGNCHIISTNESFTLKLMYLEYLIYNKEHRNMECVSCLQRIYEIFEQKQNNFVLHLPNLGNVCLDINYVRNLQLKYKRQIDLNSIPKLYEEGEWQKLTNIITAFLGSTGNNYENECWLKDMCAQIQILLQSFWIMTSYESCLIWSEKCYHFAVSHYLAETKSTYRNSLIGQLMNFITSYMEAIILNEGFHIVAVLPEETLPRMVQDIMRVLVYQFDGNFEKGSNLSRELNFKRPWVILHQLILWEENNCPSTNNNKSDDIQDIHELIPKSFLVLFTAHEYLGKRQWCTDDNGEFLKYVLDSVVLNLKTPVYDVCRDLIYEYIEQVTYCLYKYPQKKARLRHLEDHDAAQVNLCWSKAIQVFDLYRPEDLPEFNSYKLESITSDMEQLLLKMISLMPNELDPSKSIHQVTMFIEGHTKSPPVDANAFKLPFKVLSLYYLLADFYFKNRDFIKAIKFYTLDLAVNPTRFDSWAGMALSKASKIETKLNALDPLSMETLWEECEEVLRCFECCINLNRFQTLLWIEYGSFSYTIHSCFSRYLKCNQNNMSDDTLIIINERKDKMLTIAYNCFSLANSLQNSSTTNNSEDNSDANDEKWLCQYMLGKISEKRKEEPKVYLNHYLMAANYLYENNATYPIKINHSNPTMLSVEALEIFYRINAAIIKYLQNGKEITRCVGDLFNKILKNLSNSPFAYNKAKIDGNCLNILKRKFENESNTHDLDIMDNTKSNEETKENSKVEKGLHQDPSTISVIVSSGTSSVLSSDTSTVESESDSDESFTDNENSTQIKSGSFTSDDLKLLYRMVVQNIEECATRFPEHYKSIYRLIFHYMNSSEDYCDLAQSEKLLLGQYKTSLGNLVNGLFYDRKNSNLFNGIWRIPSSEIDRPGSFSAHLVKCVKIFIQLLYKTKNHSILVDLALNLSKTPDLDKRYITDDERIQLCQQSINYSLQILRAILERNIVKRNDVDTLNLLIEIYKTHKKCVKYMNNKEPMFAEVLVDVYKFFIKDKVEHIPENCNFLDLAIKLCVQEMSLQKNVEKTLCTDYTMSSSDYNVTQTSITQQLLSNTSSRFINIPGLSTRSKFRSTASKFFTSTTSDLSIANSLSQPDTDFTQNPKLLSMPATFGNDFTERDNPNFKKIFEDIYSKMLQSELSACSSTLLISPTSKNQLESQMMPSNNPSLVSLMLPHTQTTALVENLPGTSIYANSYNADEDHSHKSKSILKPYSRPIYNEEEGRNFDSIANQANIFAAYSKLVHNTTLSNIDYNNKQLTAVKKTNPLLSSHTNLPKALKEPQDDVTQLKTSTSYTSLNFSSTMPHQQSATIISPTKTLQEKLAERQKASLLNENLLSSASNSKKTKSSDDVIVLD